MQFTLGEFKTEVLISRGIPRFEGIAAAVGLKADDGSFKPLVICDENTSYIADIICGSSNIPRCVLKSGEDSKNWESVQSILSAAFKAELSRDGVFIAVGGGVAGDLAGFAASIYMRGCRFVLVSTTLLGMVDASVGGKTGFDLFGIKNLIGSFFPAECVFMPMESLASLPQKEWKSGMAELIKTAVLAEGDFPGMLDEIAVAGFGGFDRLHENETLVKCIEKSVLYKGRIVSEDLREKGRRALLNLGHTFAHALEAAAGLGALSHGEAVAWGTVRACDLGIALGITPKERAVKIRELIASFGYEIRSPHPQVKNSELVFNFMHSDKKKKQGKLKFIIPDEKSARIVSAETDASTDASNDAFLDTVRKIIKGEISF